MTSLQVICRCPWATYMYKIVKSFNVFFSETSRRISPDFTYRLLSKGCWQFGQIGQAPLNQIASKPMYSIKPLLQNWESSEAKFWDAASGTQSIKFVQMMIQGWPLTFFKVWSNICSCCCDNTGRNCMSFADEQWRFFLAECVVVHGPLVWRSFNFCFKLLNTI